MASALKPEPEPRPDPWVDRDELGQLRVIDTNRGKNCIHGRPRKPRANAAPADKVLCRLCEYEATRIAPAKP